MNPALRARLAAASPELVAFADSAPIGIDGPGAWSATLEDLVALMKLDVQMTRYFADAGERHPELVAARRADLVAESDRTGRASFAYVSAEELATDETWRVYCASTSRLTGSAR